jgi:hypothetical protein
MVVEYFSFDYTEKMELSQVLNHDQFPNQNISAAITKGDYFQEDSQFSFTSYQRSNSMERFPSPNQDQYFSFSYHHNHFCEYSLSELIQMTQTFPPITQDDFSNQRIFQRELINRDVEAHPKITLNPPLPSVSTLLEEIPSSPSLNLLPITQLAPSPTPLLSNIQKISSSKRQIVNPESQLQHNLMHKINRFPLANVKHKNWDEQDMLRAMTLVQTTQMSTRAAAELCHVPRSTLWDRLQKSEKGKKRKRKNIN